MKNRKGFTLIELLAIIIILGVIAIITVPIISQTLKDARINVVTDSAHGYVDAVNKLYYSNALNKEAHLKDGIYTVSELKDLGVSVSGDEPSDGWVELEQNEVVSFSIKIGNYVITKYSDSEIVVNKGEKLAETEKEILARNKIALLAGTIKDDGAKYLESAQEIYYNPISGEKNCNGQEGCMHWYLYSVKDNYANMILDRNLIDEQNINNSSSYIYLKEESIMWTYSSDYSAGLTPIMSGETVTGYEIGEGIGSKAASAGITYPDTVTSFDLFDNSKSARGPVTVLNTLKSITSGWVKTQTPKVPNSLSTNEYIIPSSMNKNKYQINYTGYHARLITEEELRNLGDSYQQELPSWVYTSLEEENGTYGQLGYWTSSPYDKDRATTIMYGMNLLSSLQVDSAIYGIRPVITVSIDVLE